MAYSLPGSTIIWRADSREWCTFRIITSHIQHPLGLFFRILVIFINDMPSSVLLDMLLTPDLFANEAKLYSLKALPYLLNIK